MNKLLVIDDDANIRRLVVTVLKDAGFDVCEAADGNDALLKFDDNKIDFCVVDIMMPNMDVVLCQDFGQVKSKQTPA